MFFASTTLPPRASEQHDQRTTGLSPRGQSRGLELQNFYPSPSMSRRQSLKDDLSNAKDTSAAPTTSAVAATAPSPTHATPQQYGGFVQHFHPYNLPAGYLPALQQPPQTQSYPTILPGASQPTVHTRSQSTHTYGMPPGAGSARSPKQTRKSKQHVQSACVNCKQAHLSCDDQRPCQRCTRRGMETTCVDVPHRKRGRPRIRAHMPNEAAPFPLDRRKQTSTAATGQNNSHEHPITSPPTPGSTVGGGDVFNPLRTVVQDSATQVPVAFLDMDLRIAQMNNAFRDMFSFLGDLQGQSFDRLVDPTARESINAIDRIRARQVHERDEKNPSYLPPIRNVEDPGKGGIPAVGSQDLQTICQGYSTSRETLQLLAKETRSRPVPIDLCLAKTDVIFVVLKLPVLQSPQRLSLSHGPSSISSTPPQFHEQRRQSTASVSRLSEFPRATASEYSSPSKSTTGFPPPISPISPISRQSYQHTPTLPSGSIAQAAASFYTFANKPPTLPPNPRPGTAGYPSGLGLERRQPLTYPPPISAAPQQPVTTSMGHELMLPPITALGAASSPFHHQRSRSSNAAGDGIDRHREQSIQFQQARQRSADRARREQTNEAAGSDTTGRPQHGQQQSQSSPISPRQETRKRKRVFDINDLTG